MLIAMKELYHAAKVDDDDVAFNSLKDKATELGYDVTQIPNNTSKLGTLDYYILPYLINWRNNNVVSLNRNS